MATEAGAGQSKQDFVRELLRKNPDANLKAVNEAWQEAGNEGTISGSFFYTTKREMGQKGSGNGAGDGGATTAKKPKTKAPKGKKAEQPAEAIEETPPQADVRETAPEETGQNGAETQGGDQGRVLDQMEGTIDDLIFRLKTLGGRPEVEEALRRARRLLYRGQE